MNRIRVPLVLLVATLLLGGCAKMQSSSTAPAPPEMRLGPAGCRENRGFKNADRPIVCVDDTAEALKVDPDPFVLHETLSMGATGSPAVQWFTRSGGGDLEVKFADERCVKNVVCRGGHCTAVAAKLPAGQKEQRCKYDVTLTGHPTLDPDGILTGCCVDAEPTP